MKIEIYANEFCGYCKKAKTLLDSKKVKYKEILVEFDSNDKNRLEMIQRSKRTSVPQIFIEGKHIGGCDDLYKLEDSGKLNILLNL